MGSVLTGTVAAVQVSGITITGSSGELGEATITLGKQRGKFDPVGTNVSMHTTGMKTVEGSITKRWVASANEVSSGSAQLIQQLADSDDEFSVTINVTGGGTATVSGCIAGDRNIRVAPGTEVMNETLAFTGLDWGQMS